MNATNNSNLAKKLNRLQSLLSVGSCPEVTDASTKVYRVNNIGEGYVSLTLIGGPDFQMARDEFEARLTDSRIIVL